MSRPQVPPPPTPQQQKTQQQIAKENAFLSRVKLCEHNQNCSCNPPGGRPCNFAHWLSELQAPEESQGVWSKVWHDGEVDIRFWHDYKPNVHSIRRFAHQFHWERKWWPEQIPFLGLGPCSGSWHHNEGGGA